MNYYIIKFLFFSDSVTKMASACLIISRGISTSCANYGKRNLRKFLLYGKRGTKLQKQREAGPDREIPAHSKLFF